MPVAVSAANLHMEKKWWPCHHHRQHPATVHLPHTKCQRRRLPYHSAATQSNQCQLEQLQAPAPQRYHIERKWPMNSRQPHKYWTIRIIIRCTHIDTWRTQRMEPERPLVYSAKHGNPLFGRRRHLASYRLATISSKAISCDALWLFGVECRCRWQCKCDRSLDVNHDRCVVHDKLWYGGSGSGGCGAQHDTWRWIQSSDVNVIYFLDEEIGKMQMNFFVRDWQFIFSPSVSFRYILCVKVSTFCKYYKCGFFYWTLILSWFSNEKVLCVRVEKVGRIFFCWIEDFCSLQNMYFRIFAIVGVELMYSYTLLWNNGNFS